MTRALHTLGAAALLLLAGAPLPAAAQPIPTQGPAIDPSMYRVPPGAKTLNVDCDDPKQTLAAAIAGTSGGELNIVFSGTCREYLTLKRDDVAIRGKDGMATLSGGLEVVGARRVLLEGFTCRDTTRSNYCIGAIQGADVTLHNIKVANAAIRGVLYTGATGIVDGLAIDKTGSTSMLIRGSTVQMEGELTFSNSPEGCLVLDSLASVFSKVGSFTARDCGMGILIQTNSTLEAPFASFTLNRNSFAGLLMLTHATFTYGGSIVVRSNSRGIWADDASSLSPLANITSGSSVTLENNGEVGVQVTQGSLVELANVAANTGATYGILVDDARLRMRNSKVTGNKKADVRVQFGGHATFGKAAEIGVLSCDGTELVRGTKTPCTKDEPTPTTSAAKK